MFLKPNVNANVGSHSEWNRHSPIQVQSKQMHILEWGFDCSRFSASHFLNANSCAMHSAIYSWNVVARLQSIFSANGLLP